MTPGERSGAIERLDKLYEFDREPVARDHLLGPAYFAGSFAGEHVAATEFVIGALFVNWGATIRDVFFGLALGNVLAVLTWAFLCAPIAVDTRLTLYWYLRRIGGPFMALIYNVLNAVLFCILAGCMITVSASAVRIPFGIEPQIGWLPSDPRFAGVVFAVGAVVVTLAILGFKKLASFATVCSPWMFLMFLAGALVMLPRLAEEAGVTALRSWTDFWQVGEKVVWTGVLPADSDLPEPMGFWKVAAFAWICNLAMHAGLSDMALFRYARRARYGLCSAFGMFLGHYLAWISAGVMGAGAALLMKLPLSKLDAGAVGYEALGWAGAIAVILAGWTTSNPTLYRAGLALQSVTPNWSRALVTLVAGTVTTVMACSPFVFTKLLDFVGIYGLLLMPAGAIVTAEHWIFPRLGLARYWASRRGLVLNGPALTAWAAGIALALVLEKKILAAVAGAIVALFPGAAGGTAERAAAGVESALGWIPGLHLFYLFVPVYLFTSILYVLLARISGALPAAGEGGGEAERAAAERAPAASGSGMGEAFSGARAEGRFDPAAWVTGLLALASLTACLAMAVQVFLATPGAGYEEATVWLKRWLWLPSLVYFVSGSAFFSRWQARKGGPA